MIPGSFQLSDSLFLKNTGAWLRPGALRFCLVGVDEAAALRARLPGLGLAWVGWRQREALLKAWRPVAQERYHSVAGRDAPTLRDWLAERFKAWRPTPRGDHRLDLDDARLEEAITLCGLRPLAAQAVSLLSNGESARACLAAALGSEPTLLVLDDLTEGLDSLGRRTLLEAAQAVSGKGAAVLVLASRESLLPWVAPPALALDGAAAMLDTPPGREIFACEGLNLTAGEKPLVSGLNWRLHEGEAWCVSGPNGAGKSTLLAYLSGEHPQAWAQSWRLKGLERPAWTPLDVLRKEIAWVSPEVAAAAGRRLADSLREALERPAALLILDEALRSLEEPELRLAHAHLTDAFRRKTHLAVVFVSHDASELPPWVTKVLRLAGGGSWDKGARVGK